MRLIIEFCKVNDNKIKLQVIRNILSKRYPNKSKNAFFLKAPILTDRGSEKQLTNT